MSDWIDKAVAKEAKDTMKACLIEVYDKALESNFTPGEARALARGLIGDEVAFLRVLVDYWIDSERPSIT
ncbi:unnamed protein product [marine sediment metagenome]|uniref:Uncharacterized protein n=1 Tax=marine sediment metagenome TaxID=412755 RepID=X0WRL0_9ZZZZ